MKGLLLSCPLVWTSGCAVCVVVVVVVSVSVSVCPVSVCKFFVFPPLLLLLSLDLGPLCVFAVVMVTVASSSVSSDPEFDAGLVADEVDGEVSRGTMTIEATLLLLVYLESISAPGSARETVDGAAGARVSDSALRVWVGYALILVLFLAEAGFPSTSGWS